jgi:hypothetical protein
LCGAFVHRHGFARQQRLIGLQILGHLEHCIGGNAVTFRQQDIVPAHNFASRYSHARTVADHQGAGAGQFP